MKTTHKTKTFTNIINDEQMLSNSNSNEYIIDLFEKDLKNSKYVSNIIKYDDRFEYDFTL